MSGDSLVGETRMSDNSDRWLVMAVRACATHAKISDVLQRDFAESYGESARFKARLWVNWCEVNTAHRVQPS